jgi:hypothetical protein
MIYFARKHDCEACALKRKCCPNVPARKIARSVHEAARDQARAIAKTEAYAVSCRERKKVEMLFAHLKRILRLGRLRLRGPSGAKTSSYWPPPPKICGNWPSSSPFSNRSTMPKGFKAPRRPDDRGGYLVTLDRHVVDRLASTRGQGESDSDVILRLAKA